VVLDDHMKIIDIPGPTNHLLFDPEIYFGGGPNLAKKKGLTSKNNFAGVLKNVFFNDAAILYELKKGNPKVHYIGVLEPEFQEIEVKVIPLTFSYPRNHIWWPVEKSDNLRIKFDFKSSKGNAVLAYSEVRTSEGQGFWEVSTQNRLAAYYCYYYYSISLLYMMLAVYMASGNEWKSEARTKPLEIGCVGNLSEICVIMDQ
jgi:hypothetical protein